MSPYLAVYAEIYCLAKFIIYIYSLRAQAQRGGHSVAGTAPRKARLARLSATWRGVVNEPLNNLNENKIILSSNCW